MEKKRSPSLRDSHERLEGRDPLEMTPEESGENPNAAVVDHLLTNRIQKEEARHMNNN